MCEQLDEPQPDFELRPPDETTDGTGRPWGLTAYNKRVVRGWEALCKQIPENVTRCYCWLRRNPTERIPGRCYELKHKHYAGAWCYEVGSSQRAYYKLRLEQHDVLVYYAGPHPSKAPYPP
jgi:hypothetical protein